MKILHFHGDLYFMKKLTNCKLIAEDEKNRNNGKIDSYVQDLNLGLIVNYYKAPLIHASGLILEQVV